jgi:hypothetical protein
VTTDLRSELTCAYADVTLVDPLEQVVRRGRRIRRIRRARRVGPALVAAAAVVVGVSVVHRDDAVSPMAPIELVSYSVPAFPLSFDRLPAGLTGPSFSLDPSFEEVGPGVAHAGWSDAGEPGASIGLEVRSDEPDAAGEEEIGDTEIAGEAATVYRMDVTGGDPTFSVVWERRDDQWVRVFGSGRFGSEDAVVDLARRLVDRPAAVPLQVSLAPRGWVVVAYKDDRILTLGDPAGPPATEALARTLDVHLPETPTAPADLPREVAATDGRMDRVTVHGRPGYLLPTGNGWLLQAGMSDGTVFVLQTPADFTPAQVVEIAEGVGRP